MKINSNKQKKNEGKKRIRHVLWFTGLSGSGKSTIADSLSKRLKAKGYIIKILDGDVVRNTLHRHLGFTKKDILLNNKLISQLALKYLDTHDIILVPIISPYRIGRENARKLLGRHFTEVYIKASLKKCIRRDVKGLYKKALNGEIKNFIGISDDAPYETPKSADLTINTEKISEKESVDKILQYLNMGLSYEAKEAIRAAKIAGKIILECKKAYGTRYKIKKDRTEVTKADIGSNATIINHLTKKFRYSIISEEQNSGKKIGSNLVWIIDPLDGTKDFIAQSNEFSVMIALLKNKALYLGVVYVPALDECYFAEKGKGAFHEKDGNIKKLHVSARTKINELKIILSKNHLTERERSFLQHIGNTNHVRKGSIGIKLAEIASGNSDLYFNFRGLSKWDIAASQIILEESGGHVFDMKRCRLDYASKANMFSDGIIAINKKNKYIFRKLCSFLEISSQ